MRYVFYLIFGILLIGLHTAVLSDLPAIISFYDILIPFVVYLSLFRGFPAGLSVVLIIGFVLDMVSAAPNGIYMTTFMTVFLMFRNITAYFHARETVLFTACTAAGIGIENLIFTTFRILSQMDLDVSFTAFQIVIVQFIWVLLTGPLIYRLFNALFAGVDYIRDIQ